MTAHIVSFLVFFYHSYICAFMGLIREFIAQSSLHVSYFVLCRGFELVLQPD